MPDVYKLKIEVEGANSGSERLAQQQGLPTETPEEQIQQPVKKKDKPVDKEAAQQRLGSVKKGLAATTTVGYIALDFYQQDRGFRGDSNRNARINETKKWVGVLGGAAGLAATGNPIGALFVLGYTAIGLAKENRELINSQKVDSFRANYYQQRLVRDTTQRSR